MNMYPRHPVYDLIDLTQMRNEYFEVKAEVSFLDLSLVCMSVHRTLTNIFDEIEPPKCPDSHWSKWHQPRNRKKPEFHQPYLPLDYRPLANDDNHLIDIRTFKNRSNRRINCYVPGAVHQKYNLHLMRGRKTQGNPANNLNWRVITIAIGPPPWASSAERLDDHHYNQRCTSSPGYAEPRWRPRHQSRYGNYRALLQRINGLHESIKRDGTLSLKIFKLGVSNSSAPDYKPLYFRD